MQKSFKIKFDFRFANWAHEKWKYKFHMTLIRCERIQFTVKHFPLSIVGQSNTLILKIISSQPWNLIRPTKLMELKEPKENNSKSIKILCLFTSHCWQYFLEEFELFTLSWVILNSVVAVVTMRTTTTTTNNHPSLICIWWGLSRSFRTQKNNRLKCEKYFIEGAVFFFSLPFSNRVWL